MKIQPPGKKTFSLIPLLIFAVAGFILWSVLNNLYTAPSAVISFQSFAGNVEVSENTSWKKPVYGDALNPFQSLKAGADGEADLKYNETAFLRLKKDSSFEYTSPSRFSQSTGRLHLQSGSLLIANTNENIQVSLANVPQEKAGKGFWYDLSTKFIDIPPGSFVLISAAPQNKSFLISVLRGNVRITSRFPAFSLQLKDTEMVEIAPNQEPKKDKISQESWKNAREVYELKPKTAAGEAAQMDLSLKAGDFFQFVLDHGTFYQQKWGWCEREFITPEEGSPVYLETTYDVFPRASWVGLYLKTRNLDLSKFKTLKIEARKIPGRPHPDFVRLEFKAKAQVVQAFAIKMLHADWETIEFPIRLSKETLVSELTFIFTHDKVGTEKSGGLQIRNFTLIPQDKLPEKPAAPKRETASSKIPVTIGINERAITKNEPPQPSDTPLPETPEEVKTDLEAIPIDEDLSDF